MIFKTEIQQLQDIYNTQYYNNFKLAARKFSEYENVAGFITTQIDGTATLSGQFLTNINPETYEVNGSTKSITIEKSSKFVWYDGIGSEFTVDDFTNDDSGFCCYKVTNEDTETVYYSELIYISKIIYNQATILFTGTTASLYLDGNGQVVWGTEQSDDVKSGTQYSYTYNVEQTDKEIKLIGYITKINLVDENFEINLAELVPLKSVLKTINTGTGFTENATVKNFNSTYFGKFNLESLSLSPIISADNTLIDDAALAVLTGLTYLKLIGENLSITANNIENLTSLETLYIDQRGGTVTLSNNEISQLTKLEVLYLGNNIGPEDLTATIDYNDINNLVNLVSFQIKSASLTDDLNLNIPSENTINWSDSINDIYIIKALTTSDETDHLINSLRYNNLNQGGDLTLVGNAARTSSSDSAITTLEGWGWNITIL